jgi:hypothetical protein
MTNLEVTTEGKIVTIKIDTSKRAGRSASGKTVVIASTNGNQQIQPGVFLGVNCYCKE